MYDYLSSLQLGPTVFEPDGKNPPDFLIAGRIAVEARRLNEDELVGSGNSSRASSDRRSPTS